MIFYNLIALLVFLVAAITESTEDLTASNFSSNLEKFQDHLKIIKDVYTIKNDVLKFEAIKQLLRKKAGSTSQGISEKTEIQSETVTGTSAKMMIVTKTITHYSPQMTLVNEKMPDLIKEPEDNKQDLKQLLSVLKEVKDSIVNREEETRKLNEKEDRIRKDLEESLKQQFEEKLKEQEEIIREFQQAEFHKKQDEWKSQAIEREKVDDHIELEDKAVEAKEMEEIEITENEVVKKIEDKEIEKVVAEVEDTEYTPGKYPVSFSSDPEPTNFAHDIPNLLVKDNSETTTVFSSEIIISSETVTVFSSETFSSETVSALSILQPTSTPSNTVIHNSESSVKKLLNLKNPAYKISLSPQFHYHDNKVDEKLSKNAIYAKPKNSWNQAENPTPSITDPFVKLDNETMVEYLRRVYPEMKEIMETDTKKEEKFTKELTEVSNTKEEPRTTSFRTQKTEETESRSAIIGPTTINRHLDPYNVNHVPNEVAKQIHNPFLVESRATSKPKETKQLNITSERTSSLEVPTALAEIPSTSRKIHHSPEHRFGHHQLTKGHRQHRQNLEGQRTRHHRQHVNFDVFRFNEVENVAPFPQTSSLTVAAFSLFVCLISLL